MGQRYVLVAYRSNSLLYSIRPPAILDSSNKTISHLYPNNFFYPFSLFSICMHHTGSKSNRRATIVWPVVSGTILAFSRTCCIMLTSKYTFSPAEFGALHTARLPRRSASGPPDRTGAITRGCANAAISEPKAGPGTVCYDPVRALVAKLDNLNTLRCNQATMLHRRYQ